MEDNKKSVSQKNLIQERKYLLSCIKERDSIIDLLLDAIEEEHIGSRSIYSKIIFDKYNIQY